MNSKGRVYLAIFSVVFALCICSFIFIQLQSCGGGNDRNIPLPPSPDFRDILEAKSEILKANIFIDASGSMKGFVNLPETSYKQVIRSLEYPFVSGWANKTNVTFYKFIESKLQVLPDRNYRDALNPDFYTGKFTRIQIAFDCVDLNCLNVVITDLLQSDDDTMLLIGILKDKLNKQKAVLKSSKNLEKDMSLVIGVLGVKSKYRLTEDITRPFYMIMIGKHSDIVNYYELMESSNSLTDKMGFSILSNHLVEKVFPDLEPSNIYQYTNVTTKVKFVGTDHKEIEKDATSQKNVVPIKNYAQLIVMNKKLEAKFSLKFDNNLLPYTVPFDFKKVKPEIIIEKLQNGEFSKYDENNIVVESSDLSTKSYNIKLKTLPQKMQKKGVYRYKFVLRPSVPYKNPDWWLGWNTGIFGETSKTQNLNLFMDSLWKSMVQAYQPKVAEFYCYIKIR